MNRRLSCAWRHALAAPRRDDRGGTARGQSLVEFALVIPVLLLLVLVAIDFGRVYLGYVNLQGLARIAANYAANNPTTDWTDNGSSKVAAYNALITADATATNCALQPDGAGHNPPRPTYPTGTDLGDQAQVQLTCHFPLITPIISRIFGSGTIDVSASAVFPVKSGGVAGIGVGGGSGPQVPNADFTGAPTTIAAGGSVTFTDISTNAPTSWQWNFGDGNGSNVQNPPAHTYTTPGTYTVSLTATNADGFDTEVKSAYITVLAASVVDFSGTPISGPAPLAVQFTDQSTGAVTWAWQFGDGGTSAARNPSHTYNAAGTYDVTLTITDALNVTTSLTKTAYVSVAVPQCVVPNVSDGATRKNTATTRLQNAGFVVVQSGSNANWFVRVQSPQGGLSVSCGSTVTIFQ